MALGFPLALVNFFDAVKVSSQTFTLADARQFNTNGGGEVISASLGSRLWTGEVSLVPQPHQEFSETAALVELLLGANASFRIYDKRHIWPASDPTGSILGAATPTLGAVNVNNVDVTIAGLPVGYVLTAGDMFRFSYLSSPARQALHRVVVGATADGSGNATVQVVPPIRTGYALAAAISLERPYMNARIIPGSYSPPVGAAGKLSSGLSFGFMQRLR